MFKIKQIGMDPLDIAMRGELNARDMRTALDDLVGMP